MSYTVRIFDRRTGEAVDDVMDDLDWGDGSEFWRSEGNFGCDCNRALTFYRAKGIDVDPEETYCVYDDFPRGRFVVLSITLPSGEVVYTEKLDKGAEA